MRNKLFRVPILAIELKSYRVVRTWVRWDSLKACCCCIPAVLEASDAAEVSAESTDDRGAVQ